MITLSHSYGTVGLLGNSISWNTPNHTTQSNRQTYALNSPDVVARRNVADRYFTHQSDDRSSLWCSGGVGFHTTEIGRYFQREEFFIGFWHDRSW
jgi:hypothetical protein